MELDMNFKRQIDVNEVAELVNSLDETTKVYIGCDSERYKVGNQWYADYILAVVVHINGNNGCRIFGAVQKELDYDQKYSRPRTRLMNEVYKVSALYLELSQVIAHDIEVHLDINPNEMHGSSCVINEAVGYVRGMCNVVPLVKPRAFAASYAADRFKSVNHLKVA
jgi:predicted RNase H-related nuclease YkuK (DUF458 family)